MRVEGIGNNGIWRTNDVIVSPSGKNRIRGGKKRRIGVIVFQTEGTNLPNPVETLSRPFIKDGNGDVGQFGNGTAKTLRKKIKKGAGGDFKKADGFVDAVRKSHESEHGRDKRS
jgi:hypothetical protein